jgi:hypothetical protein
MMVAELDVIGEGRSSSSSRRRRRRRRRVSGRASGAL